MKKKQGPADSGIAPVGHFFVYWLPIIIYCLAIFIQSSFPASEQIPKWSNIDKVLHFSCYAVLAILFLRAFRTLSLQPGSLKIVFYSLIAASLYGISDEIHQYFVPSRDADIWDVVANTLGACLGATSYHLLIKDTRRLKG